MAPKKTKLELTWIGKDNRPRLEPRILIEEPKFSHHASTRREGDIFDNMLIHGDNLRSLRDLCGLMVSDASAAIPDVVVGT